MTLEFVEALSDIEISGDGEGRDEFLLVSLYAGVCVGFLAVESVIRENVRVIDAAIKTGCVVKWVREPFDQLVDCVVCFDVRCIVVVNLILMVLSE